MNQVISPLKHSNLSNELLIEHALQRKEGVLSATQALRVTTGKRTGRSPKDRFIVKDSETEQHVAWGDINQPISTEAFDALWQRASAYMEDKETYVSDLQVGADPNYCLPVTVITELAWHNLFVHHLFIKPQTDLSTRTDAWTLLNAAGLKTDPDRDKTDGDGAVMINFSQRRVLLCGMLYAGEMKKAMFSVLNFLLPLRDVLPMHCAANVGEQGDVALFFGLSGTGKTTLSADPERYLIGDDEHGWGQQGVFNFEGGCYAKCIDLSPEREPVIWNALRDGAILENVMLDSAGQPDYHDDRLTKNTRGAYPRSHIPRRVEKNSAGTPKAVVFLTCDLSGVLPPVSLLTKEQAAYHFLSGYTAKVASTEVGGGGVIKPTFGTGFGAPFLPRVASVYANLLMKRVEESGCQVYLINTGWTGGAHGQGGERFSIPVTRAIVRAALSGELLDGATEQLPGFNLTVPKQVKGVDSQVLNPGNTWKDSKGYVETLNTLIKQFIDNSKQFQASEEIINAGPSRI